MDGFFFCLSNGHKWIICSNLLPSQTIDSADHRFGDKVLQVNRYPCAWHGR